MEANLSPGSGFDQAMSNLTASQADVKDQAKKTASDIEAISKTTEGLQPPTLELPPKPEIKTRPATEAFGSPATALAILGGLLTRRPIVTALNGAAGVMKAYREQDEEKAKQAFETWKVDSENAVKMADFKMSAYNAIINKAGIDIKTKQAELEATAHAFQDDVMVARLQQDGWEAGKRLAMEQQRLTMDLAKGRQELEEHGVKVMAIKALTGSAEYKQASPTEKLHMLQDAAGPETWDKIKVQLANSRAAAIRKKNPTLTEDQAKLQAMGEITKATTKSGYATADTSPELKQARASMVATGMPMAQAVPGWGAAATEERRQAQADAVKLLMDQNPGMTAAAAGEELVNRQIDYAAGRRSVTQLNTMLGATRQAVSQLEYNVGETRKDMAKLPSSDISPVINAIARGAEKWDGDPAYSSLFFHMHAVAAESARLLSGGQASVAQLHQGAMDEAKGWANADMTPESFLAPDGVAASIIAEGKNRLRTYEAAIEKQRLGGKGKNDESASPSDDGDIKRNKLGGGNGPQIGTIEDGYRFKGGDPADQKNWERIQ